MSHSYSVPLSVVDMVFDKYIALLTSKSVRTTVSLYHQGLERSKRLNQQDPLPFSKDELRTRLEHHVLLHGYDERTHDHYLG